MRILLSEKVQPRGSGSALRRWAAAALALLLAFLLLPAGRMSAQESGGRRGTLTVALNVAQSPVGGYEIQVFKVGSRDASTGQLVIDSFYSTAEISMAALTTSDAVRTAAHRLLAIARGNVAAGDGTVTGAAPYRTGATGADGTLQCTDMEEGIYLVASNPSSTASFTYQGNTHTNPADLTMVPALITLPSLDKGEYDRTVAPKAQISTTRGSLEVTKLLHLEVDGEGLATIIAADAEYQVGLYYDPEGKAPVGSNNIRTIHIHGKSSGTAVFENLEPDTYYLLEVVNGTPIAANGYGEDANGNPMGNFITVNGASGNKVELDFSASTEAIKAEVDNVYYRLPEDFFKSGYIRLKKSVMEGDQILHPDETFYASVYYVEGEEMTLIDTVPLSLTEAVTVEVPLIHASETDSSDRTTTYCVEEVIKTGEDEYESIDEGFSYMVELVENGYVDLEYVPHDPSRADKIVEIVNRIPTPTPVLPTDTPTPTPTPTLTPPATTTPGVPPRVSPTITVTVPPTNVTNPPSSTTTTHTSNTSSTTSNNSVQHSETSSTTTIKTGDDTPLALYVILLALAAATLSGVLIVRSRKR